MMNNNKVKELSEQLLKEVASSVTGTIDIMDMVGNIHIQIGDSFASVIDSDSEYKPSDLEEALQQLINQNFISKPFGNKPESYKITDSGRRFAKTL